MPGIRKPDGPHKYNKVNQQRKYHLLSLFYKRRLPLREAAETAGINYLTAKTILFFHKNNHKSYQFDLQMTPNAFLAPNPSQIASVTSLKKKNPLEEKLHQLKTRIQVICSIGNVLNPATAWGERPPSNSYFEHSSEAARDSQNSKNTRNVADNSPDMPIRGEQPIYSTAPAVEAENNGLNLQMERVELAAKKLLDGLSMMKTMLAQGEAMDSK